jgi:hypothetical protein
MAAALGLALVATPSQAAISWDLRPSGTGNWDWRVRGLYEWHRENDSFFVPWTAFYGFMWHQAADHCIEVATGPGRYVSNPDTRIWVRSWTGGTWQSVNDDFAGTLQSKARLWISYPVINGEPDEGEYFANIAPYNSVYEGQDFELIVTRRDLSEAACTTDQTTIPWVKIIGNGTQENTLVFSPNAN